jgi:hypothetical protein
LNIEIILECAYGFRYAKLNGRFAAINGNPDYDPWSIRQVAVYQQYNSTHDRNTFLIVAPADELRQIVEQEVLNTTKRRQRLNPFRLHLIVLQALQENWRLYIRDLEITLKKQVISLVLISGYLE